MKTKYMDIKPFIYTPDIFGMKMGWLNEVTKEGWIRQHNLTLINIKYGRKIPVRQMGETVSLGTQDGYTYTASPLEDCDCEPDFTCHTHANKFTEKH